MNTTDLKITLAQYNVTIGDFDIIFQRVSDVMTLAERDGSDVVVFPELFLSGYPPLDRLEQESFLSKVALCLDKLKTLTEKTALIIGAPEKNKSGKGKALYNSALFLHEGKILHTARKGLIPNYDVFDEYRYFEPSDEFKVVEFKGHKIALTICEDLWDKSDALEYKIHPMEVLMQQNPDCIINIAASPFDYLKYQSRKNILIRKAEQTKLPLFYVNNMGAQAELIFDGGSMAISPKGEVCGQMRFFEEDCRTFSLNDIKSNMNPLKDIDIPAVEKIYQALVLGIRDYFSKTGFKKAVLGLSGGVDSALVAVLAAHALGSDNVQAIFLPTAYSSDESLNDARLLAEHLKMPFEIVSIESSFRNVLGTLQPVFKGMEEDITEENIQSRLRGMMLMAFSNKFGNILLNTSNKSEMATGYGTLYGDMCGSLSVIGDLYKTQVYELCRYINREEEIIPENILTKAPTAELKPGQKDSDSLPEYSLLDTVLFHYLEIGSTFETICGLPDVGQELAAKIVQMVDRNEFKRFQAPPVLRVSPKAFGMGRRFPLVGKM
jgi:NAD+ synthase (glutamine-hydrolysing)